MLLEQSPALALGHATPNTELDLVVQRICRTLLHYRTVTADHRGLALCGSSNKEFVRVGSPAQRLGYPRDPLFRVYAAYHVLCSREVSPSSGWTGS